MKKTILSMLFLLAGIGCFAQKSGIIIGVTDGHLGKYSGYAYMSTGTANNSSYPETRWTPGVGFNLGYQFGFDLSMQPMHWQLPSQGRLICHRRSLGKAPAPLRHSEPQSVRCLPDSEGLRFRSWTPLPSHRNGPSLTDWLP